MFVKLSSMHDPWFTFYTKVSTLHDKGVITRVFYWKTKVKKSLQYCANTKSILMLFIIYFNFPLVILLPDLRFDFCNGTVI